MSYVEKFDLETTDQLSVEAVLLRDGWHVVDEGSFRCMKAMGPSWHERGQEFVYRPSEILAVRFRKEVVDADGVVDIRL